MTILPIIEIVIGGNLRIFLSDGLSVVVHDNATSPLDIIPVGHPQFALLLAIYNELAARGKTLMDFA